MNFFCDVAQFLNGNICQPFALAIEMFVNFDRRFLHDAMGLLRTAGEDEIRAAGNPFLTVFGVESQTEQCMARLGALVCLSIHIRLFAIN